MTMATNNMACECGAWTGEACAWAGPIADTVLVEYMPEQIRASHRAARNHGSYPANGSVRVRVERSCARLLLDEAGESDWSRVVDDGKVYFE